MKMFDCPACGMKVEAGADYVARGVKCPNCGQGFIPVLRRTRVPKEQQMFLPVRVWVILGLVLVGIALATKVIFVIGVAASAASAVVAAVVVAVIAVVVLLAGIFVRLGKLSRKS